MIVNKSTWCHWLFTLLGPTKLLNFPKLLTIWFDSKWKEKETLKLKSFICVIYIVLCFGWNRFFSEIIATNCYDQLISQHIVVVNWFNRFKNERLLFSDWKTKKKKKKKKHSKKRMETNNIIQYTHIRFQVLRVSYIV